MRRHVGKGEQSDDRTPEAATYATFYGSAIHDVIAATEEGFGDQEAIEKAWARYGRLLEPSDLQLLHDDLAIYRSRDFPNTRTVASEDDFRVPLFKSGGQMYYFRFKLDRLYERLDAPGTFVHVDYKSSRHAKSDADVHSDLQLWAYNWAIHENWPEVERLHQVYDQLRYGQIPTAKSDAQRAEIKDWLIAQVKTILADDSEGEDGLLEPKYNQWCPWCPIMESCPVVGELTDFALARIGALQPQTPKLKADGTPGKKMDVAALDPSRIREYAAELPKVTRARQVLERFEESVKGVIREMDESARADIGYALQSRRSSVFTLEATRALYERLGDRFFEVVKITKTGLESGLIDDDELLEWALGLADEVVGATAVVQRRDAA